MTNGEKIQTILDIDKDCTEVYGENGTMTFTVTQDFWNAEYKEPTTKNDLGVDYVSRQEVDRLARIYLKEPTDNHVAFYEDFLYLPSVTPQEPKMGYWIHDRANVRCSNCGKGYKDSFGKPSASTYNYCPNCGAKMVEPQESEDRE